MKSSLTNILIGASLIGSLNFNSCNYNSEKKAEVLEKSLEFAKIDSLNNYAYELRNKDPIKALTLLDSIQKTAEEINYGKGYTGALVRKGNINQNLGNYELAKKDFYKFLEIKTSEKDSLGIADGLYSLGMIFADQGNYNDAVQNYTKALKIYEKLSDSLFISKTCNYIGMAFDKQGKYNKALEYYNKSLDINKALNDSLEISSVLNNVGTIFDKQKEYDKALQYYFSSLKISNETNDKLQQSICFNNIADAYRKKKDLYEAFKYYYKAIEINKETEDKEGLTFGLLNLGILYLEKENHSKALENLKKADTLSKEIGNPSLQKDIYETFSQIYKAKKDFKKSLEYYVLFSQTKDTLINEKSLKQVAELSTIYETEKKENENNLLRKDNQLIEEKSQKQKWGLLGLAGIVTLLAGGGALLYKSRKKIQKSKKIIEEKNKEITDSINYARNIQRAIIPNELEAKKYLGEHFIFYKPKDIVSGDFYWLAEKNEKVFFSACDCTGHGIPGAFMHMTINAFLNGALNEKQIEKPNEIFNDVRNKIINSLKSKGEGIEQKDGMDSVLCAWDKKTNTLEFACANNPLFLIRDNKLNDFKEDRMPVGYSDELKPFKNNAVELKKNDMIYIFSDGYQSQFGGPKGKKFMKKNFRELLFSINQKPLNEQKEILNKTIEDWMTHIDPETKKPYEQTDDLLVIGLRFGESNLKIY